MAFAHNGDVQIFYETFGDAGGVPLILINGLGSQCINYRQEWCERFVGAGFFVIRFDNRDVGLSTHFDAVHPDLGAVAKALGTGEKPDVPYTVVDMANDVVAVLDALEIDQAHAMGLSMGGMIVQQLAIDHPDRLLSLTSVMSSTGEPGVGLPTPEAQALLMSPPPPDRDGAIARYLEGIRTYGSPACYDEARLAPLAAEAYDRCFDPAGQARQIMAIMSSPRRAEPLTKVTVPALVIHGDADKLVNISGGQRTAELIPGARFVVFEGMGHDYPPEYWDRWVDEVAAHAKAATA